MKTHNIKIQKQFANDVYDGIKTFEIRFNDRDYHKGEHIIFKVFNGEEGIVHGLNFKEYEITYVLEGWGLEDNYVALAIKEIPNEP